MLVYVFGIGGSDQPDGPAPLVVRVEGPRGHAPAVGRDEPQLVEAVGPRVAQAVDLDRHLAADARGLDGGADLRPAAAKLVALARAAD